MTFDKNEIIIFAGEEPRGVVYLEEGIIRKYSINNKGNEIVINVYKPGSYLPISWALEDIPNEYFYDVSSKSILRIAPKDDVKTFLTNNLDVALDLLERLYKGIEGLQKRMVYLMGENSTKRVLLELAIECKRFGLRQKNGTCILNLHESEIAHRSGLTRETVNRELVDLKNKKLIEINHRNILVKDLFSIEKELD